MENRGYTREKSVSIIAESGTGDFFSGKYRLCGGK